MQDSDGSQPGAGLGDEAQAPRDPQLDAAGAPADPADEDAIPEAPGADGGGIPVAPAPAADAAPGEDPAQRLREERLTTLFEAAVYGPGDERIGKVGQVYVDDQTQEPNWVTVKTGLFGTREYFLPLDEAVLDGRKLVVPYAKDVVVAAPGTEIDQNLSPAEEDALYNYYRVPGRITDEAGEAGGETLVAPTGVIPTIPVDGGEPTPISGGEGTGTDEGRESAGPARDEAFAARPSGVGVAPASQGTQPGATGPGEVREPFGGGHPEGGASDAAFTAGIRAEHGSSDEPRGGDDAVDARHAASGSDERELGTERVHDESRGDAPGVAAPGASGAVRERYAADREAERIDDEARRGAENPDLAGRPVRIGYDGVPHPVEDADDRTAFRGSGADADRGAAPGAGAIAPDRIDEVLEADGRPVQDDIVTAEGLGLDDADDGEVVELDAFRRPEER